MNRTDSYNIEIEQDDAIHNRIPHWITVWNEHCARLMCSTEKFSFKIREMMGFLDYMIHILVGAKIEVKN